MKKEMKNIEKENNSESLQGIKEGKTNVDNPENNLTFIDGVLLTWKIFDKILQKQLTDENGELEKDDKGYKYLNAINDDVTDSLLNKVLEHGYFKNRGDQLIVKFDLKI